MTTDPRRPYDWELDPEDNWLDDQPSDEQLEAELDQWLASWAFEGQDDLAA